MAHEPVIFQDYQPEELADEIILQFRGVPKANPPQRGFMVFLCKHYPVHLLRDALGRAKADYLGDVRKSLGAVFTYELGELVKGRRDLVWYNDNVQTEEG